MFKLDLSPTYKYPVTVRFFDETGRRIERRFTAHFRRLKKSEAAELMTRAEAGEIEDAELMREIVAGWEGIADADGHPIECNDETIAELADIHEVASAIGVAWFESLTGGARKN